MTGSAVHGVAIDRCDDAGSNQDGGYASGRVWIDMPHTAENGAVEFEDAVVTYFDDPAAAKKE